MAQMYKVFFKERTIFLKDTPMVACISYGISNFTEINKHIERFINQENSSDICLVHENPKKIFAYLKTKFNYVQAAGGLVFNTDNRFLSIYRYDKWDLPKGKIEKNEQKREAAIREVEEECGITAPVIVNKLITTYHIYKQKQKWELKKCSWYLMRYDGNEKLSPQKKEGITRCKWFRLNEKNKVMNATYNSIKDVINTIL